MPVSTAGTSRAKGYDCSSCHNFSRTERGLTRVTNVSPSAPAGPAAQRITPTQVKLVWADQSNTEQGFRIERSLDGVNFTQISTAGSNVTSMVDSNLNAFTSYYYRVRAYNTLGNSGYSMTGGVTTPAPELRATAAGASLVLSWPQWGGGFTLQAADRVTAPAGWAAVPAALVTNSGVITATLPVSGPPKFYRLLAAVGSGWFASRPKVGGVQLIFLEQAIERTAGQLGFERGG